MPAYATQDDLVTAYGEQSMLAIADRDGDSAVDDDVVAAALAQASELIDSYTSEYQPLVVVPSVKQATLAIAFELLHGANLSNADSRLGYDRALAWLREIAAGKAVLPGQPGAAVVANDPGEPLIEAGERVWDRRAALRLF